MENKRIFLSTPTMNGHEMAFIQEAFDKNWVTPLGENVDEFENAIASYVGAKHAAALCAGTAALHLALKLAGVKQGDIVFSSCLTFSATCNPITYEKAVPVFIDAEQDTWNMSPDALREGFKKYPNAKAVVVANLYGTPAKLDEIAAICKEHGVPLIEDAAESLGSTLHGQQTGTFGDFGVFSFNGNKIITSSGGGMLVSENEEAIKKARFLATQAREPARHYEHKEIGYNYRMSNIVAGIGRGQMLTLDDHVQKKQKIYEAYKAGLAEIAGIAMNPMNKEGKANNWLSCMTIAPDSKVNPLDVLLALEAENMESRPIWKPMNLQPVYKDCDFIQVESVNGDSVGGDIFARGLCLPSDIKITAEEMDRILSTIKKVF